MSYQFSFVPVGDWSRRDIDAIHYGDAAFLFALGEGVPERTARYYRVFAAFTARYGDWSRRVSFAVTWCRRVDPGLNAEDLEAFFRSGPGVPRSGLH